MNTSKSAGLGVRILSTSGHFLAAAILTAAFSSPASAIIVNGNIETSLRPAVWLQYGGGPFGADQTAVGIFDTGDPSETLSRETAARLGIGVVTPQHVNAGLAANYNQGTTAPTMVTSGGWLGGTFDLERDMANGAPTDPGLRTPPPNDPTHVFTNAAGINRTAGLDANNLRLWYLDYNRNVDTGSNGFTENHTSMAFMSATNAANNRVAFVDPINATPLPYPYDNSNGTGASMFDGNGRNVFDPTSAPDANPANLHTDQRASSVSYFAGNDPRVPTPANNTNPGFVHFVDLTPREFSSTLIPQQGGAGVVVDGTLAAGTRNLTLTVSNADGPNVTQILPRSQNGTLDPEYQPGNAANNFLAYTGFQLRVATGLDQGGQVNPNGFVRTDGSVNVRVVDTAGNVRLAFQNVVLPSQAPRPFGSIVIPELGINTGAAALIDTGAPTTTAGSIVGTDILNRFGQIWDFRNVNPNNHGRLTLIGPSDPVVREALANGMLFNVDAATTGLARTAVEQEKLYGTIPQLQIGAATEAGIGGGDNIPNQTQGTVFRTHLTGSNATYIDENAMKLNRGAAGQTIDSMSLGGDRIGRHSTLYWSVSAASTGGAGSDVGVQKARNQSAADVFTAKAGGPATNRLFINQEVMGLGANFGPLVNATASNDNLLDFDLFTDVALPADSLSNLDSPIEVANDTGTITRQRAGGDVYTSNFDNYFSTREAGNGDGARIYRSSITDIFASGHDMGLADMDLSSAGADDVDALSLFRPSVDAGVIGGAIKRGAMLSPTLQQNFNFGGGFFVFDPNTNGDFAGIDMFHGGMPTDLALFSLAPNSQTLNFFGLSPADLFITDFDGTFSLYASAGNLGLALGDNIDGLDSVGIPEPATWALLLLAILGWGWRSSAIRRIA